MILDSKSKITISLATVGAILAGLWGIHKFVGTHTDRYFFSEAQAQTLNEQVKQAVDAAKDASQAASTTSETLAEYIRRQELKELRERLNVLKGQLSDTQLWESANGANDISRARKNDLSNQIASMELTIRCVEAGGLNC